MMMSINNINLIIDDQIVSISSEFLNKFYIANLDQEGNETNYLYNIDTNNLVANFLILSIKNDDLALIKKLKNDKCITNIEINFVNGRKQSFELPKNRIISLGKIRNDYEEIIEAENDDLCILVSNLNLRNKKALFV